MAPDAIAVGPMLIALSVGNGWVGIFLCKFKWSPYGAYFEFEY